MAQAMIAKDEEFMSKLLATFRVEAAEHLAAISTGLLELEKTADAEAQAALVERVFREVHSLRGAARSVNRAECEALCRAMEDTLAAMKRREIAAERASIDPLLRDADRLQSLLTTAEGEAAIASKTGSEEPGKRAPAASEPPAATPAPRPRQTALPAAPIATTAAPETVRVSTARLDAVLLKAEELVTVKLADAQQAAEVRELYRSFSDWRASWGQMRALIRGLQRASARKGPANGGAAARSAEPAEGTRGRTHGAPRWEQLAERLREFTDDKDGRIAALERGLAELLRSAQQKHRSLSGLVDRLLGEAKELLMHPFSELLGGFPKLVRDLARDRGVEAELAMRGAEIQIDRRILQEMKDPFTHLLRNCIDHGVEPPLVRQQCGKPRSGTIAIAVAQKDAGKVEITLADDGAGVDTARLRAAAVRAGLLAEERAAAMADAEVLALMFHSGVTTSAIITDLSGRGLGLAIVQEKVERLGGEVSVASEAGSGTTFRILLPLTLATFRGLRVQEDGREFIFPAAQIGRTVRLKPEDVVTVENRESITLDGQAVALAGLGELLGIAADPARARDAGYVHAVVLDSGPSCLAFKVDRVIGEEECLVKGLGRQLSRVRNIAGATVLGSGRVVPVLNVADLMKSAVRTSPAAPRPVAAVPEAEAQRRSVLVAEDSLTARALMKNILEAAGYEVATAVDGMDALTALKEGSFDLLVSDVDMPRMNGFDLTARIRADQRLAQLPVVLVTALESREDRERGIDVGANAYLVKSSFDQSNLLEIVGRLI